MARRKRTRAASLSSAPEDIAATSTASSPAPEQPLTKKQKFEERYKTDETSDVDVLNKQMKTWSSIVYEHFRSPPEIKKDGGNVRYVFVCKKNPSITVNRSRHDESTSNLVRHTDKCSPGDTAASASIAAFAHGSTYSYPKFRMKIALWVSRRHRPFAIVEDNELIEIFMDLNNKVEVPSQSTVSRDVKEIFQISRVRVAQMLQAYPGKLHICLDGWTSPNVIAFIGATVHWVVDGRMQSLILDFIKASKAHTGTYLASRVSECLHGYGIHNKILALTADNASNNNPLTSDLEDLLDGFQGSLTRIRCFAHILNLVVKAILSQFSHTSKASPTTDENDEDNAILQGLEDAEGEEYEEAPELDEDDDGDEIDPSVDGSDAAAVDVVAAEVEADATLPLLTRADINLGRFSLSKLRNLAKRIFNSPTIRADLEMQCKNTKIPPRLMVRDVATRWNSTASMLERALQLREALMLLVGMEQHNKPRGARLNRFKLSKQEWDLLSQLFPLLDVFLSATKRISANHTPLLHQVIPLFDIITRKLDEFVDNEKLHPAVRTAAARGRTMLNKYYGLSDESIMYRIAMLLHPRYKSSYFIKAGWPSDWIKTAEELLRSQYRDHYKLTSLGSHDVPSRASSSQQDYFEELDFYSSTSTGDPIDEWLSTPALTAVDDGLGWWTAMDKTGHPLARMSLNFLSAPATSTDVERAFSRGGLTVSKMRHSLSDESTRAATVLSSWCDFPSAIPREDIITTFREKSKRPKGKGKDTTGLEATARVIADDTD